MKKPGNAKDDYRDIIGLPYRPSPTHPKMSLHDRAAQFAPFAALSGYEDEIDETARLTDRRITPDEEALAELDERIRFLAGCAGEQPPVSVVYFRPDERKEGGAYLTACGNLKRLDETERMLLLTGGQRIPLDDIFSIDSPWLPAAVLDEEVSGFS